MWAGRFLLAALFLDLAGTRWASYLPTPLPDLYLPDALFATAALLAALTMVSNFRVWRLGTALLASVGTAAYVALRVIEALSPPHPDSQLWVRDMAPFLYVALIPLLVAAAQAVPFSTLLRTLRLASATMAVAVVGQLSGLLDPIDIGTEIPIFSPRPDVDNAVLGIGILAFGDWGGAGRPRRVLQSGLLLLAAANYSRAGLLAAAFCLAVAAVRERRKLLSGWVIAPMLSLVGVTGVVILLLPNGAPSSVSLSSLDGVSRLMGSDLDQGTTGARIHAWRRLVGYTQTQGFVLTGAGPGAQPLMASGAVDYLSGAEDVRAPHNWFIGLFAYHGLVGVLLWSMAYARVLMPRNLRGSRLLPSAAIGAYMTASLFGVVAESPFGSLPMAALAAWTLAHEPAPGGHPGPATRAKRQ